MLDPLYLYSLLGSFALMFSLAAIEKKRESLRFAGLLANYRLIPPPLVQPVSALVIAAEALTAALLITPAWQWGVVTGGLLLTAYALGIAINLVRGRTHIDCGCLGGDHGGISWLHVLRNGLLLILLLSCLLPVSTRELGVFDFVVIPLFLAGASLAYACLSMLLGYHLQSRTWWPS